jgi:TonB family protein
MRSNLLLALLLALSAMSQANAGESFKAWIHWNLSLDSEGRIADLSPIDVDYLPTIRQQIEPTVRSWHFTPGKVDGRPEPTRTTLIVGVALEKSKDDQYVGGITSAATGPTYKHIVLPEYPHGAHHRGSAGGVMLRVDFDAEGRVTSASDVPEMEAAAVDPALTKAALVAVKHWTFRPETVASHGVSGAAFVPVCFRIRDEECRWKDREGGGRFVANEPVPLNSVASVDMGKSGGAP